MTITTYYQLLLHLGLEELHLSTVVVEDKVQEKDLEDNRARVVEVVDTLMEDMLKLVGMVGEDRQMEGDHTWMVDTLLN